MMSPSEPADEPVSPRSDNTDSTQQEWFVVSPEAKTHAPPSPATAFVAPGLADESEAQLELHSVPGTHEDAIPDHAAEHAASEAPTPKSAAAQDDDGSDESQQRFFQTQAYAADFQRAAQAAHPKRAKFSSCFRLLVAGAPSTGKTTFIQNFASSCGHQGEGDFGTPSALNSAQQPRLPHSLSTDDFVDSFTTEPTSLEEFVDETDNLCTRVLLTDEAAKIHYHVSIQDTPGFHFLGQESDAILAFIEDGNADYMRFEQSHSRPGPMSNFEDTRVDVCLYFVAPHNLRPVDVSMINAIGQHVPVIPVIGKADSMTKVELEQFRQHISKQLAIGAPGSPVYSFSADLLKEAGLGESTQVFSIISSCVVDASVGVHWPVRNYPWGFAEALNSAHSDVPALKRLLIELSFDDLKKITDHSFYTNYRPMQLKKEAEWQAKAAAEKERAERVRQQLAESAKVEKKQTRPAKKKLDTPTLIKYAIPMTWLVFFSVIFGTMLFMAGHKFSSRLSAVCPGWHSVLSYGIPSCDPPGTSSGQRAPATCLSALELAALHSPKQAVNRELWSLLNLSFALGRAREDAPLCPEERGALAYQAAVAKTELEALERKRGGIKQLSEKVRKAIGKKALSWQRALVHSAAAVGHSAEAVAERIARKMPVRSDGGGRMIVDMKALKRVFLRCGVIGFWF